MGLAFIESRASNTDLQLSLNKDIKVQVYKQKFSANHRPVFVTGKYFYF